MPKNDTVCMCAYLTTFHGQKACVRLIHSILVAEGTREAGSSTRPRVASSDEIGNVSMLTT